MPGGFVGVDVFFVISGFLITCLMLKDFDAGTFSLARFWERRIRRILPALFFVVASSSIIGWFLLIPSAYAAFGHSVCELVRINANGHFARFSGYFDEFAASSPLLHSWSLAVEEQFYLLVPLLFCGVVRIRRRSLLEPIVVLMAIISIAIAAHGTFTENPAIYFRLTARAWELLAGVGLALRLQNGNTAKYFRLGQVWREAFAVFGAGAIVVPCLLYNRYTPIPAFGAVPPVLGAMALIALGADGARPTWVHRLLATRSFVGVGLISYSLYLWHWPIFVFFKHYNILAPSTIEALLLIAVSTAAAFVTYRFVETPFRRQELLAGRASLFAAAVAAMIFIHTGGTLLRSTEGASQRVSPETLALNSTAAADRGVGTAHLAADIPKNLLKLGVDGGIPRLLVWGDSHAGAIMSAVDRVCRQEGVSAVAVVHHGWSPIAEHLSARSQRTFSEVEGLSNAVKNYLRNGTVREVVLAAYWHRYCEHPRFRQALIETVDELQAAGCRVSFMKEIPGVGYDIVAKLTQCSWRGEDPKSVTYSRREYDLANRYYETLIPDLIAHGVRILDPLVEMQTRPGSSELQLCDSQGIYYSDSHHLSVYGGKIVEPLFHRVVETIVAERDRDPTRSILVGDRARSEMKTR
jgi:peptidoglycan/LPS O-acetylase OafA/YrhL